MTPVRKQFSSLLQKKKKIDNQFQHMIIDLVRQAGEYKCILEMWRSRKRRVNFGGVVTHIYVKFVSFNTTSGNETLMMLAPSNLQQQCQEHICQVKNLERFGVCLHLQIDVAIVLISEPQADQMQVLSLPEVLEKIMCAMVREEFGESIVIQKEYDQQLSSQRSLQRLKIHKVCQLVR